MRRGTPAEQEALAALRHFHVEACRIADGAGLLRFGEWKNRSAWFIADPGGRTAQARRMDGLPWPEIEAKAQTLHGSWSSWPIGAGHGDYQRILFCEGGPDMLAALHFGYVHGPADFGIVGMLGAGQRIHPNALPWFANKRVRIFGHGDTSGRQAAQRWAAQLRGVGCKVDAVDCGGYKLNGGAVSNDLNDLCRVENQSDLEGLLPNEND